MTLRNPSSFSGEWYIEANIWVLNGLVLIGESCYSQARSVDRAGGRDRKHIYLHTHIHYMVFTHLHPYFYLSHIENHEYTLIPQLPIQCRRIHFRSLPFHICNSLLGCENLCFLGPYYIYQVDESPHRLTVSHHCHPPTQGCPPHPSWALATLHTLLGL